jgi:hypothetical protein
LEITTEERKSIRQYLLGNVREAELTELEERLLSDDNFYEELLIVEDELIDQYLLGALSEPERNGFVSHFLITDERQEKLRFSKTLRKYLNTVSDESTATDESAGLVSTPVYPTPRKWFFSFLPLPERPAFRLSLAAISLLVVIGVSWIVLTKLFSSEGPSNKPQSLFVATLSPGLTRDVGETARISIPADRDTVRLQLQLELSANGYESYTAELMTLENSTLVSRDKLQPEVKDAQKVVSFDVPAEILNAGDYQVRLSGVGKSGTAESVGRYPFRVVN